MEQGCILVVEDESIVSADLQIRVRNLGFTIAGAATGGEEAVRLALEMKPDLVLMDIQLRDDVSGIEAARRIKESADIPVVFVSANSDNETLQRAKLAGPFGYVLKPFEERELRTTLEMALYKHRMDRQLRESEERYRTLVESMGEGVGFVDLDERFEFANAAAEMIFGVPRGGLVGCNLKEFTDVEDQERIRRHTERRLRGEKSTYQHSIRRRDGERRIILLTATPRRGPDGKVTGSFGVFRDVTEWEHARRALRQSERRYRDLFDSAPVGYHELDSLGRITRVNRTELQLLGYTEEEMLGHLGYEFLVERDEAAAALQAKLQGRKAVGVSFERVMIRKNGGFVPVLMEDRLLLDERGKIIGIRTTLQDITERKRAEEELRQNVERLTRALRAASTRSMNAS